MVYDEVSNQKMLFNLVITIRAVNCNRGLVTDEFHSPLGVESLLAVLTRITAKARERVLGFHIQYLRIRVALG